MLYIMSEALDMVLPEDYRTFLQVNNGGFTIEYVAFKSLDGEGKSIAVEAFSSISVEDNGNLDLSSFEIGEHALDEKFIAIAYDGCGNYLCLRKHGPDAGKIYWLDHDCGDNLWQIDDVDRKNCDVAWDSFYLVQDSFSNFVNAAYKDEEAYEMYLEYLDAAEEIDQYKFRSPALLPPPVKPSIFKFRKRK
ncbi:MAG: hypothetical protein COA45_12505 [Zetaproteobacteria bacterium]|nr:MAG: hypothetical protein COA45_12505 [Zetaproteobacteria bacterium]